MFKDNDPFVDAPATVADDPTRHPVTGERPTPERIPSLAETLGASGSSVTTPPGADSEIEDGVFDSIADYLENGLEKSLKTQSQTDAPAAPASDGAKTTISGNNDPLLGQGIEISVEIYIEILEAISSSAAAWWAMDESQDFSFDKKMKARYARVAELYAKTQNVQVSPGFLFFAFTVVLLGQVGFRAHKTRTANIRAENFRRSLVQKNPKKNHVGQTSLDFGGTEYPEEKTVKPSNGGGFTVPESERLRKDWRIDKNGYYERDGNGVYLKKEDRKQRPSAELAAWMADMYRVNLVYPSNKQVKTFLQSL